MKYKILALLGALASSETLASIYTLDQNSLFTIASGSAQLTGALKVGF